MYSHISTRLAYHPVLVMIVILQNTVGWFININNDYKVIVGNDPVLEIFGAVYRFN